MARRLATGLAILSLLAVSAVGQPAPIPESRIDALREELTQAARDASSVSARRALKGAIREAEALAEASPDAPNRFAVWGVVFEGQKRLLSLEATERNRGELFDTCRKLLEAPDAYAELRLEADLLLSERDLAARKATVADRVAALRELLGKYRGTPAEWKSLEIGSLIALKLLAFDLENQIRDTMSERFAGDPEAIAFRRKMSPDTCLDAVFSGTYASAGGSSLCFPNDRLGHQYLVAFWSKEDAGYADFLGLLKAEQERLPGRFEIYSFNLDELPDAGRRILRDKGVHGTAMPLPGGRENSAYKAYAGRHPAALLVNAQGHAYLASSARKMGLPAASDAYPGVSGAATLPKLDVILDDARYLAQWGYLFIGDFLVAKPLGGNRGEVTGKTGPAPVPEETLQDIESCFTPPPFRYRLTPEESLSNYRKAEKRCAAAIAAYPEAPDLWRVRNRRIIALLGMWNLARDPERLKEAVEEAHATLGMNLPPGADAVARFGLATEALRHAEADPAVVLDRLVEKAGGPKAPAGVVAAAAILAVEANAKTLHEAYRERLLDSAVDPDPRLWPVYAFLRDRLHRYRNFHFSPGGYGYNRPQKYQLRYAVSGLGEPMNGRRLFKAEFKNPRGGTISIPDDTAGRMMGIIFAEPPADPAAQKGLMKRVAGFAGAFSRRNVKVMVAFLDDDNDRVRVLAAAQGGEYETAVVPDGLGNPVVQQLGILSADRVPNVLLLRPDGTIAWRISGLSYHAFRNSPEYAIGIAIGANIEKVRADAPFEALENGDFRNALALFEKALPPQQDKDVWTAARLHGRALAYMGLKDWTAALGEIDAALRQRESDFRTPMCKCHGVVEMLLTKATILDKLGRGGDAATQRRLAAEQNLPHAVLPPDGYRQGIPVGVYYERLKRIRLALEDGKNGGR